MRIAFFVHSLLSDWNHGNAHFLRGVTTELVSRGHEVRVYEPRDAWSLENRAGPRAGGIIRNLAERGHRVTFYEPDAFERQQHRDIPDPEWAKVVVYPATQDGVERAPENAQGADVVKASGVGIFDEFLEAAVLDIRGPDALAIFWDVDAPATLDRMESDPRDRFRPLRPAPAGFAGGGVTKTEKGT